MLTFLRQRLGDGVQLNKAISDYRASQHYMGSGATVMGAVEKLYEQEKAKQSA